MKVEMMRLDAIRPYENNPRKNDGAVEAVAKSIQRFGFQQPVVVDRDGVIVVGHTRYRAAESLGMEMIPVVVAADLSADDARAYRIADNSTGEIAAWDLERLGIEIIDLDGAGVALDALSLSTGLIKDLGLIEDDLGAGSLAEKFGAPPFTVLDARAGWWQQRKAAWINLGIQSEIGRGENLLKFSDTVNNFGRS